jgi:hypothetical protein
MFAPSSEYEAKYNPPPPAPLEQQAQVRAVDNAIAPQIPAAPPKQFVPPKQPVAPVTQPVTPAAPINQGLGSLPQNTAMPTNVAPGIANIAMPDRNTALLAAEAKDPYLKKQPGEIMEKYLERMTARDEEGKQRFQKQEEAQTRSDLWRALIEGGESTRGLKGRGLASSGTGFGKSALSSMDAARQRETAQANL